MKLGGVRKLRVGYQAVWCGGGKGCTRYFRSERGARRYADKMGAETRQAGGRKRAPLPCGVYQDGLREYWIAKPPRWAPKGCRTRSWSVAKWGDRKAFSLAVRHARRWNHAKLEELNRA